ILPIPDAGPPCAAVIPDCAATAAAPLTFITGGAPTAAVVLNSLSAIPGLAGNVAVFGANGGAQFLIVFINALANANVPQMTTTTTGGTTATPATVTDGYGNEVQSVTLGGTSGGTVTPAFNGSPGTPLT